MPYILDTDLLTIIREQSQPEYGHLHDRMSQHLPNEFFLTIVSLQEQVQGWLRVVNEGKVKAQRLLWAYEKLLLFFGDISSFQVLPFDQPALDCFNELRSQRVRISTMDLRIASIALVRGATVLTRNLRDFRRVPDLNVEDWTQPEK